jgi:hypothetical protein
MSATRPLGEVGLDKRSRSRTRSSVCFCSIIIHLSVALGGSRLFYPMRYQVTGHKIFGEKGR